MQYIIIVIYVRNFCASRGVKTIPVNFVSNHETLDNSLIDYFKN